MSLDQALLLPTAPDYLDKLRNLFGPSIVALHPMAEPVGAAAALDYSGHGYHGAYTTVALGQPGPTVRPCASFDGTASFNNVYSAGHAGAFNGPAGTLSGLFKASAAGVWGDGITRRLYFIGVDAGNRVLLERNSAANTIVATYTAGATAKTVSRGSTSPTDWFHFAITWDKAADQVIAYYNGAQTGTTQTSLGTWVGTPISSLMTIGAGSTAPANVWSGFAAYLLHLNRAASAAEMKAVFQF